MLWRDMSVEAATPKFVQTVRQKVNAVGKAMPIWCWKLQRGNVTVAFGERCEEQAAVLAAQVAEQNYGRGLGAADGSA